MDSWIILSIIYGLLCGTSDLIKKQVLKKINVIQTLILFNLFVLIILIFTFQDFSLNLSEFPLIFIKSICIFLAWLISFWCIKKVQISHYSIIMLSKVIFSSFFGVLFLNEFIGLNKILGFLIISIGIIISNFQLKKTERIKCKYIILILFSAALISASLLLDKIILKTINESTLQFYYTLILTIFYFIVLLIKKERLNISCIKKEPHILSLAIVTYLSDYAHFVAASDANSSVVVMTLLRHSSLIVAVVFGTLIFKEKNILIKSISLIFVIIGLILTILKF